MKAKFSKNESGGVAIIFAASLALIIGLALLIIDGGKMINADDRGQNIADTVTLGSAKWIVRVKKNPENSDLNLGNNFDSRSWLPTETQLKNYAMSNLVKGFEKDQSYAKLRSADFSVSSRCVEPTTLQPVECTQNHSIEVKTNLCSDSNTDFTALKKPNKTCTESVALIEGGELKNKEIAISFEANYGMGLATYFSWAMSGRPDITNPTHPSYTPGVLKKYIKSTERMKRNNVWISLIPFTEKMNIHPYSSSFIQNYNDINPSSLNKYEPKLLMSRYPILRSDEFEKLISSDSEPVKYPSFYDVFRTEEVNGKKGLIYEENPALNIMVEYIINDTEVDGSGMAEIMTANIESLTRPVRADRPKIDIYHAQKLSTSVTPYLTLRTALHGSIYRTMRRAYSELVENRYIQPLTTSWESLDSYFKSYSKREYNLVGNICADLKDVDTSDLEDIDDSLTEGYGDTHDDLRALSELIRVLPTDWRAPDPLESDVPPSIKTTYKNKYLNCHLNVNGYGEDQSAHNWIGLWWAWETLNPRNRGLWNAASWNETQMNKTLGTEVPNRSNIPETEAASKREKIIIHIATSSRDYTTIGKAFGLSDSYSNIRDVSRSWYSVLLDDSFQIDTDFEDSAGGHYKRTLPPVHNSNSTSYEKLCDKIKDEDVEIYVFNISNNPATFRPTFYNQMYSCASKPENFIMAANGNELIDKMDALFNSLTDDYTIRLVR